jgi:hypothetical protein
VCHQLTAARTVRGTDEFYFKSRMNFWEGFWFISLKDLSSPLRFFNLTLVSGNLWVATAGFWNDKWRMKEETNRERERETDRQTDRERERERCMLSTFSITPATCLSLLTTCSIQFLLGQYVLSYSITVPILARCGPLLITPHSLPYHSKTTH